MEKKGAGVHSRREQGIPSKDLRGQRWGGESRIWELWYGIFNRDFAWSSEYVMKKSDSLGNNEERGENKIFQLFFFSCSFLSFCVLLDYEMVSFHSGPSHTNVSGNWWSGNWYLHHGLQILGNTVTLGLTASIQIHPPEWLENQRVASGGGQSEGMNSQFRPKNGYFLAFIVVVSKRKADGTWTLKMNLEMKAIVKGKMLCNNFFSLMWIF